MEEPDPATGLTPREKRNLIETWGVVKKDIRKNGETLLIRFCIKHPEHHVRFTEFAKVPGDKLVGNKALRLHANSVMYALNAVIDNLDDTTILFDMLHRLGYNHGQRAIPEQGFKDMKVVLLDLLQDMLGPKLTPDGAEAWSKMMNVVYAVIFRGMRDAITQAGGGGKASTSK